MRITPDLCARVCFNVNRLLGGLGDCAVQDAREFFVVTLIIHISGNHNSAPEGRVVFKYFFMNPNFRHGSLTLKFFSVFPGQQSPWALVRLRRIEMDSCIIIRILREARTKIMRNPVARPSF
jgi:hypothetical protein